MCRETGPKSKPLLLRAGTWLAAGVGRGPSASTSLGRGLFPSGTALATQSNSSRLAA